MRITKLSLTNFRSFKETQSIEFAPVTLLFGPNSVGKSSVLMALFYLHQILDKGQCDPMRIDALGDKFVGGFKNMVHGRDLNSSITIKIEYDKENKIGSSYFKLAEIIGEQFGFDIDSPAVDTEKVAIQLVISWSATRKRAYVSNYTLWLNDVFISEVTSDQGIKQPMLSKLNYLHPLLLSSEHDSWLEQFFYEGGTIHNAMRERVEKLKENYAPRIEEYEKGYELPSFSDECWVSWFHEKFNDERVNFDNLSPSDFITDSNDKRLVHKPISLKFQLGALPILNKEIESMSICEEEQVDGIFSELLSEILIAPLDNLYSLLNNSICIGPLRHIPDANYQLNPYPAQSDWYDGKACWDSLSSQDLLRDSSVNEWLADTDKLNLGYKIVYKTEDIETRYIEPSLDITSPEDFLAITDVVDSQMKATVSLEDPSIDPDARETPLETGYVEQLRQSADFNSKLYVGQSINKITSLSLWDCQNNIEVAASDVGVGISQLLPLIVAGFTSNKGFVACEQPELHVHPRVQVALGDFLTQYCQSNNALQTYSPSKINFLIETHSEHIILRLLRRVRETSCNELPKDFIPVTPESISVMYLENSNNGVTARKLKITEDGDFDEDWPGGFFEERDEELF